VFNNLQTPTACAMKIIVSFNFKEGGVFWNTELCMFNVTSFEQETQYAVVWEEQ